MEKRGLLFKMNDTAFTYLQHLTKIQETNDVALMTLGHGNSRVGEPRRHWSKISRANNRFVLSKNFFFYFPFGFTGFTNYLLFS